MALLWIESYARHASTTEAGASVDNNDGGTAWTFTNLTSLTSGASRFGNYAGLVGSLSSNCVLTCQSMAAALPAISGTTLIIGFDLKYNNAFTFGSNNILAVQNTSAGSHFTLQGDPGLGVCVIDANSAVIGDIDPRHIMRNCWQRWEIKISFGNSGSCEIRIDGVTVLSLSSKDFQNGASVTFGPIVFTVLGAIDNIIVMDGSGSVMNDFIGDVRLEHQLPDADGSTAAWTPTSGSNYTTIDDAFQTAAATRDGDYISSSTTDQINLASQANFSLTDAVKIWCVGLYAITRADAGSEKIALMTHVASTDYVGADYNVVNNAQHRWRRLFWAQNPNTSADWTLSDINGAEFGVKKRV